MYLPNLVTIGAMKAGTTSLHEYLSLHPDIYMSEKKEINFFSHNEKYENGVEWYKKFFPLNVKIRGESSQSYSKYHLWENVPKRIYKDLGKNVKFIYILRDPLKRVYSHYNEMQAQNVAPKSLEEYVLKDLPKSEIVLTSCYKKQLDHFLAYFPLENFKIITLEDLKEDKMKVLNEIFSFLEVENISNEELFSFTRNTSQEKTKQSKISLFLSHNSVGKKINRIIPNELKNKLKSRTVSKKILNQKINHNIQMPQETEEKLKELFKKDVNELRSLTGLKFPNWWV